MPLEHPLRALGRGTTAVWEPDIRPELQLLWEQKPAHVEPFRESSEKPEGTHFNTDRSHTISIFYKINKQKFMFFFSRLKLCHDWKVSNIWFYATKCTTPARCRFWQTTDLLWCIHCQLLRPWITSECLRKRDRQPQ